MGTVTALFVRKVIGTAGDAVDGGALLASLNLTLEQADVKQMVPDTDYYDLLERISDQLLDATAFPLSIGGSMRCDDYGAFGLAWKTAPTLRGSLDRAARYARLLTSVAEYEIRDDDQGARFLLHRNGPRRRGLRLSNEATLASALTIMQEVSPQPVIPLGVHLRHAAPRSITAHESFFGCPVAFDSDFDGICLSTETLESANRLGDRAISQYLEPMLQTELAAARQSSFEQSLLRRISDHLSNGPPRAADIARDMGMSERTLHRRLSEEGTSFQGHLASTRHHLAEGLLAQSDHSIAEIAFLTGFSEQSSFTRAFKRWVKETPAAFRERHKRH